MSTSGLCSSLSSVSYLFCVSQCRLRRNRFRNRGDDFEKVSGLGDQKLQVEKAGWSWGGQFVDVDNDGYLDIYASSGFYTAPEAIRIRGADL